MGTRPLVAFASFKSGFQPCILRTMLTTSARCLIASSRSGAAAVTTTAVRGKATLPDLPYDYNALEPVISAEIMQLHHSKHHQTYVNNLNAAEDKLAEAQQKGDVSAIIGLSGALKFNGGGHLNHSIFWQNLSPDGGEPSGSLLEAINRDFGSVEAMQTKLSAATVAVQGSGWGW